MRTTPKPPSIDHQRVEVGARLPPIALDVAASYAKSPQAEALGVDRLAGHGEAHLSDHSPYVQIGIGSAGAFSPVWASAAHASAWAGVADWVHEPDVVKSSSDGAYTVSRGNDRLSASVENGELLIKQRTGTSLPVELHEDAMGVNDVYGLRRLFDHHFPRDYSHPVVARFAALTLSKVRGWTTQEVASLTRSANRDPTGPRLLTDGELADLRAKLDGLDSDALQIVKLDVGMARDDATQRLGKDHLTVQNLTSIQRLAHAVLHFGGDLEKMDADAKLMASLV